MAPLPHNNTDVWYLDYSTLTLNHTMEMRTSDAVTAVEVNDAFDGLLTAANGSIKEITILGLRKQESGSSFSLPIAWTGASNYGTGVGDPQDEASFLGFAGRGSDGRRVRIYLFGYLGIADRTTFRIARGSSTIVDDMLTQLETDPDLFKTIGGTTPSWKQYANVGLNAYWQRQLR